MEIVEMTLTYFIAGNQILMPYKKKKIGKGKNNGVGGKMEKDETHETTMVRECVEEVGLKPIVYDYVSELTLHNGDGSTSIIHVYLCTQWEGNPIETEEMNPEWFDINNIPYDRTMDDDKYWLPAVLSGKKIIGDFHLDENYVTQTYHIEEVPTLKLG